MRTFVPIAGHRSVDRRPPHGPDGDRRGVVREIQGGKGYVGEFVIHRLYRDVQGHPVQSGTANVLSLDLLERSRRSAHDVPSPLVADSLDEVDRPGLDALATTVRKPVRDATRGAPRPHHRGRRTTPVALRSPSGSFARPWPIETVGASSTAKRPDRPLRRRGSGRSARSPGFRRSVDRCGSTIERSATGNDRGFEGPHLPCRRCDTRVQITR